MGKLLDIVSVTESQITGCAKKILELAKNFDSKYPKY